VTGSAGRPPARAALSTSPRHSSLPLRAPMPSAQTPAGGSLRGHYGLTVRFGVMYSVHTCVHTSLDRWIDISRAHGNQACRQGRRRRQRRRRRLGVCVDTTVRRCVWGLSIYRNKRNRSHTQQYDKNNTTNKQPPERPPHPKLNCVYMYTHIYRCIDTYKDRYIESPRHSSLPFKAPTPLASTPVGGILLGHYGLTVHLGAGPAILCIHV